MIAAFGLCPACADVREETERPMTTPMTGPEKLAEIEARHGECKGDRCDGHPLRRAAHCACGRPWPCASDERALVETIKDLREKAEKLADKVDEIGECDHSRRSCASVGCIGAEVKALRSALTLPKLEVRE